MAMYEKVQPPTVGAATRFAGPQASDDDFLVDRGVVVGNPAEPDEGPLRMIEWTDLVARLKAARDLRRLFRRDAKGTADPSSGSFTDAAARYFREREEYEEVVNPVALERSKASSGIVSERSGPKQPVAKPTEQETRDTQQQAMREKIDD